MDDRGQHGGAIAIVGIACQFPGAKDPAEFHALTVAGRRMFRPISGPVGRAPRGPLHGALLDDWAAPYQAGEGPGQRDPAPLHKLTAETIALALADAGIREADLRETGIREAGLREASLPEAGLPEAGARTRENAALIIASTIPDVCRVASDGFGIGAASDFPPPAYLDSLRAVAAACDALRAGAADIAVAGGAELGVADDWLARRAAAGDLGTTQMRVYDAEPTGLLPGDGCGVVVLMRSADARAAGLPVYAEIVGWAARQASPGAYDQAMIRPADVQLVEGHGAGTAAGDLAELSALTRLRQDGGSDALGDIAALGAVSACIGYSAGAAGVASLIKAVVAMVSGMIPPAAGWVHPHQLIESGEARLRLPVAPEPWPDGTRLAAVNSLGPAEGAADGAHLVLRRDIDEGGHGRRRGSHAAPRAHADADPADPPVPVTAARAAAPGRHTARTTSAAHAAPAEPAVRTAPAVEPAEHPSHAATEPSVVAAPTEPAALAAPVTSSGRAAPVAPPECGAPIPQDAPVASVATATLVTPATSGAAVASAGATAPPGPATPPSSATSPGPATPVGPATRLRPAAHVPPAEQTVRPVPGGPALPGPITVPPARAGGVSGPAAPPAADVPATRAPDVLQAASSQNTSAPQVARTSHVATPDPQTVFAAHDSARESGPSAIFALCGAEPAALAATLDVIAGSAAELAVADLWDLARNLAAVARRTAERNATLRLTVTAATPGQLAVRARHAAQWLRGRAINGVVLEPGISLSAGAAGRAVIVFPGLASTAAGHAALLAGSLGALTTLDRLGITAVSAVGYSLGEIAGLVWAGCLPPAEAARLASLHGRILQGCASPAAATARVTATSTLARQLCAQDDLHIAAYEAPSSHLLTGSGDGIRSLVRRGAADGIPVEVLAGTSGLHSPALARCVAPLRTVLAATPLAPPGRRLVSTITGQIVTAADDIAALLTSQLTSPVLFAQAMAEAAARADLIIVAGQQPGLTSFAAAAGGRPAITLPPASSMTAGRAAASSTTTARRTTAHGPAASGTAQAEVIAALFAAGAVDDLAPFLRTRQQEPELMTWAVPPMRNGSQDGVQGPGAETTGRYEKWRQKSSVPRPKSAS